MELDEARKIVSVSEEEEAAIKRYLGFRHTEINILGNLTPENYNALAGKWALAKNEKEVRQAIKDFVNIYSAMYKKSRGGKPSSSLTRGTSVKNAERLYGSTNQFLSSSTDKEIAKRFCEYGNAALIYIHAGEGVPFLYAEDYRGENSANESEVILAPFCKVVENRPYSNWDGYKYYQVYIEKDDLEEKTPEELDELMWQVVSGFSQDLEDIKEYNRLNDKLEIIDRRKTTDPEERKYNAQQRRTTQEKFEEVAHKVYSFERNLQSLLKGLCKQKELEVDRAMEVIDADYERKMQEAEKKRLEEEAAKKETERVGLRDDVSNKALTSSQNAGEIDNNVSQEYQHLLEVEKSYQEFARRLGIDFYSNASSTNLSRDVSKIHANIEAIQSKLQELSIPDDISREDITKTSEDLKPSLDGVNSGLETSKSLSEIVSMYASQSDDKIKRSLYLKVQGLMRGAKGEKLLMERQKIDSEHIGLFGRLTGKDKLKKERLANVDLRMKLLNSTKIAERSKYSVRDMLAEMYAFSQTELGGTFTPEMDTLFQTIRESFRDTKTGNFSMEYISKLAESKISEYQSSNLPTVQTKGFMLFRRRSEINALKLENQRLQGEIMHNEANRNGLNEYRNIDSDAVALFEQRLSEIADLTKDKSKEKDKFKEDTLDLWGKNGK